MYVSEKNIITTENNLNVLYILNNSNSIHSIFVSLGKTHIKKVVFLVVGPLRIYPPTPNDLVVHAQISYT